MKYWLDTEFLNRGAGHPIDLISIGIVAEDGREYYGINVDAPLGPMVRDGWMRQNIWPTLPLIPASEVGAIGVADWDHEHEDIAFVKRVEGEDGLREEVYQFLVQEGEPEIWGSYSGFDYVVLSQLFGTFNDRRAGMPMLIYDIQQVLQPSVEIFTKMAKDTGRGARPVQVGARHHALDDAKHTRDVFNWMFPW